MSESADPIGRGDALNSGNAGSEETAEPADHADELRQWAYDQMPIVLGCFDADNRLVGYNMSGVHGLAKAQSEMRGLRVTEIRPGPAAPGLERAMERVLRTGEQATFEVFGQIPGEKDRLPHPWTLLLYPLKDPSGEVRGVASAAIDTTEQYVARQRLALINAAGAAIGTTLDATRTAQELVELVTEKFADFVSVDLIRPGRGIAPIPPEVHRAAQNSVLAGCPESLVDTGLSHRYPEGTPMSGALATGRSVLCRMTDSAVHQWLAADPERSEAVARHGIHSMIVAPIVARGSILGLVQYVRHRNPAAFDVDDLALAEEITARAGLCLDNALRYTRERDTGLALQRSLLPRHMLRHSALDVASRYLPAGPQAGVGGDWFDVIPLSGARVALVVGDVVGHGIHASATMGRLRTAVRALADVDVPPDELLTYLDDLVLHLEASRNSAPGEDDDQALPYPGESVASCLYAVYDPVSRRCVLARAGHPAPAIAQPDGTISFPELPPGPPLGLGSLPFESTEVELPDGSLIALFTDGLIESRDRDVDEGIAHLRYALTNLAAPLEEICDTALSGLPPGPPTDDIALLLARAKGLDASKVVTWDVLSDPAEVAGARRMVTDKLAEWELDDIAFVTELIVSELVTNAIRYGIPPVQLRLIHDLNSLICEVSDASSTSPHLRHARVFDEGGRGLLLVAQLADRWGTRHTTYGKTIWASAPTTGGGRLG